MAKDMVGRFGTHYETLPHTDCTDPQRCDCECDACMTAWKLTSQSSGEEQKQALREMGICSVSNVRHEKHEGCVNWRMKGARR